MKKVVTVVLITVMLFSGCSGTILNENSSIVSFPHSEGSALETSSQTDILSSDSDTSEKTESIVYTPMEPPWIGKLFNYYGDGKSSSNFDVFIEWAKSGGTIWKGKSVETSEYQMPFINWAKESKELLLPNMKKEDYLLHVIYSIANSKNIDIIYSTDGKYDEYEYCNFEIKIFPKTNEEIKKDIEYLAKQQYPKEDFDAKGFITDYETCPYGECYRMENNLYCFFKKDQYMISVKLYNGENIAPYDPEYFNWFDLEKISLE